MRGALGSAKLLATMTPQTRTLTLLFTDMVASTELLGSLEEREAERLRHGHFAALGAQIERHGGRQVKNLGDGVMATFEAARDAIEAAVAMQLAIAGPAGRRSPHGRAIRIGVSSGDVSVEHGDCFGTPVVEAARLCAQARGGQVLVAESTRLLARSYEPLRKLEKRTLKGLAEPTAVWEAEWSPTVEAPLRVVLADDAVLVREGVARVLEGCGIEVLAQAGDPDELLRLIAELRPDLAIVDVRMPPTHTTEGLEAAERILAGHPAIGVLILSQDLVPHYAERLLAARPTGVGYLLKESVADVREFDEAIRRVAAGGQAFDPALLAGRSASGEQIGRRLDADTASHSIQLHQ